MLKNKLHLRRIIYLLISATAGCAVPPNNSTSADQVPNINEELTRLKDARWEQYEWSKVDDYITNGTASSSPLVPSTDLGGCAVGLAEEDEIVYLGTYGDASPGNPWHFGTIAPVGSVSKTFTAMGVMKLSRHSAPDGGTYLDIFDRVEDYLNTSSITLAPAQIDNILDHTSGVGGTSIAAAFSPNWSDETVVTDCIALNNSTACPNVSQLIANPRSAFAFYESNEKAGYNPNGNYSNVGYSVLGSIIDEITANAAGLEEDERGYEKYLWSHIGDWTSSILDTRRILSLSLSHSWRVADGDFLSYARGEPWDVWEGVASPPGTGVEGWEGPAGGWALTIGDLTRFAALFGTNNDFLSNDLRQLMVQQRSTPLANKSRLYGLGVFTGTDGAWTRWYHGGDIASHSAFWAHWPDINGTSYSVVIQCNNGNGSLAQLEPAAVWLVNNALIPENEQPKLKTNIATLINLNEVNNAVYKLSFRAASFEEPSNLFLPLQALDELFVTIKADKKSNGFQISVENHKRHGKKPVRVDAISDQSAKFETFQSDIRIGHNHGKVLFKKASLKFGFSDDLNQLADLSLAGTIDTRQLSGLPMVEHWEEICNTVEDLGSVCEPCDDGEMACLPVLLKHITGSKTE